MRQAVLVCSWNGLGDRWEQMPDPGSRALRIPAYFIAIYTLI